MSNQKHYLDYERTDDMSVLSNFYCGIQQMDDFIHDKLQAQIEKTEGIETYVIKENRQIVAMTALLEKPLVSRKSDGTTFILDSLEIEYLAVKKELRNKGIGRDIIQWIYDKAKTEHPNCKILGVLAYADPDYGYSAVPFYEKCHFVARKSHAMAEAVKMTRLIK